jgi:NAD(P)-dependent dehydrogenase (short-subunit alcohol dehydrogenase family)
MLEKAIVIGTSGAIGKALSDECQKLGMSVVRFSRPEIDLTSEQSIIEAASSLKAKGESFDLILVATGILHTESLQPEKSIKQIDTQNLHLLFQINAIGPLLVLKHFSGLLNPEKRSVFAVLSARVGSISDNKLGGWYGYRASKAALNMLLKTASIEYKRTLNTLIIAGLHPGTVDSKLSKPFQTNVPKEELFTPEFAAQQLLEVVNHLEPEDSGYLFGWDGKKIDF